MANDKGISDFKLNQLEYCYLVEDTEPDAKFMKVFIPKLMQSMEPNKEQTNKPINNNVFLNENKQQLNLSSNIKSQGYMTVPVQLEYSHEHKHHHCSKYQNNCVNTTHGAVTCCPGSSDLKPCYHFHHDHHFPHVDDYGKIPAGTKLICLFMDNNINDCRITRLCCEF